MKWSILLLLFLNTSVTKHKVEFFILDNQYHFITAQIKIFKKGVLLQKFETKGKFQIELEEGMYAIQVIRCTTTFDMFQVSGIGKQSIVVEDECSL